MRVAKYTACNIYLFFLANTNQYAIMYILLEKLLSF